MEINVDGPNLVVEAKEIPVHFTIYISKIVTYCCFNFKSVHPYFKEKFRVIIASEMGTVCFFETLQIHTALLPRGSTLTI
jgi:hypothetical protein